MATIPGVGWPCQEGLKKTEFFSGINSTISYSLVNIYKKRGNLHYFIAKDHVR